MAPPREEVFKYGIHGPDCAGLNLLFFRKVRRLWLNNDLNNDIDDLWRARNYLLWRCTV